MLVVVKSLQAGLQNFDVAHRYIPMREPSIMFLSGSQFACTVRLQVVLELIIIRAVGADPAGPAAAGPIFGQLTRAKMPYELRWVVQLLL